MALRANYAALLLLLAHSPHKPAVASSLESARLVEHLERSGFIPMKKPSIGEGAALGQRKRTQLGFETEGWEFKPLRARHSFRLEIVAFPGLQGSPVARSATQDC
jgi:hypothetical protein